MGQPYDKVAKYYDGAFAPLEKMFLGRLRKQIVAQLPVHGNVLEIGAGTGANFQFYPQCEHAVASEISGKMLKIARTKSGDIELVQADAECLPFPADHFDAVFATLVFCSVPDPDRSCAEIMRLLKPGGKFIVLEHVRPNGLLGYVFDLINLVTVPLIADHFNRRTDETIRNAGFHVVRVERLMAGVVNIIVSERSGSEL